MIGDQDLGVLKHFDYYYFVSFIKSDTDITFKNKLKVFGVLKSVDFYFIINFF